MIKLLTGTTDVTALNVANLCLKMKEFSTEKPMQWDFMQLNKAKLWLKYNVE